MRRAGLWAGVVIALLIAVAPIGGPEDIGARRTAAVAALMAAWWLTEAVPLAATALLPLVLFPALGILRPTDAAAPYANPVVFLFMGGFMLALAMQRWGLHRRIALAIVAAAGTRGDRLVLGFMLATAFLSMWISNTATAAMMVPIGIAICELLRPPGDQPFPFATALMLGIAYAATIGGVGTLIGTPPNAVFAAAAAQQLGRPVGFTEWLMVGMPVVIVLLPLTWLLLVRVLFPVRAAIAGADIMLHAERQRLGPMARAERITAAVFILMAAGWIMREPKSFGAVTIPGIATFAPGIDDAAIAIAGALLLFLAPAGPASTRVLEWEDTRNLPWGVLLLFGGGLSLARAFEASGLAGSIAQVVGALGAAPTWLLLLGAGALILALSELASNTAVAAMAMPILAATAVGIGVAPLPLMAAGALASSCAFMLPVGTPPNAVVFATGYIGIRQMAATGVWLNLLALGVVTLAALLLAPVLG
jgi:solute carrier family 13 (sodium-dependent dicarboxylate transporter), member 2/3/5